MPLHVVVGTSASGIATARLLAESGDRVRILSRRGGGPEHPLIERIAADARDADRLTTLTDGGTTLFNCATPAYNMLPVETPALATALLSAAERTGAGYINLSNTYGYGPADAPLTEDRPMAPTTIKGRVRAQMWEDALTAHREGRIRFAEVRPGDFIGPGQLSVFNLLIAPSVLAGKTVAVPADLDAPHSWAYPGDVARTLVTLSRDERAWGRAWHVPPISDVSVRQVATRFAELTGAPAPHLVSMSPLDLHNAGLADPIVAQMWEMQYQYQRPCLLDASLTAQTFDLIPTPLDEVLLETAQAFTSST
ncbi:NAD-dependent epimerase/dehydratase family protein [Frankia sp. Mgl5]|uniref:NAD-dependent epimerase/dehydratase family protein n=1 Tax=Frankia sp. Mgl5 TaxID=2933793 RepID=UPI00200CE433|nr:NAD-dependent epimerase/dehydratase family protein [Frankia sp. Mgl5]MCK9928164.1 NAD-dependent epimerase/dehydratase family protein [Frankia sp. Mgl5]